MLINEYSRLIKNFRPYLITIMLSFSVVACSSGDEQEYMKRAKQYLETNELNAASLELKNALLKNAQNGEARYLLGKINLEIGDASSAEKEMRRAKDAGWDEAETQLLLAEALLRQGKPKQLLDDIRVKDSYEPMVQANLLGLRAAAYSSLKLWDDAVDAVKAGEILAPDALWLLQSKARLAIHYQDLPAVKDTLVKALIIYPENKDLLLLSAGLSEADDHLAANAALQKVIDLEPPGVMTAWGRQAHLAQFRLWFKYQDLVQAKAAIDPVLKTYAGDPEASYLGALLAFSLGKLKQAEDLLLIVLRSNPTHREALLLFGQLSYAQKDFQQAAHYLEKATSSQPENTPAQKLLGKTYLMLEQYEDAEKKFRQVSSQSGEDANLLALVGLTKIRAGETSAGIAELERAASIDPADMAIRSELATAYLAGGNTAGAIQTLEQALDTGDNNQQFQSMLLLTYVRTAAFDKAHALADEMLASYPGQPLVHNLKGVVYENEGNLPMAGESYRAALVQQADNSLARLGLARLDLARGDSEQAATRYRAILEKQPDNSSALVALAKLSAAEGDAEAALAMLDKARTSDPDALETRLILANYHLIRGDTDESLLLAKEAVAAAPHNPVALLMLARVQLQTDKAEALRSLERLVDYSPAYAEAHYYLAQAQLMSDNLAAVRSSLQQAISLKPDYLQAQLALAKLDLQTGNVDTTLATVQQLLEQHNDNAEVYILQADALVAKQDLQAALSAYQQALKYAENGDAAKKINQLYHLQSKPDAGIKVLQSWLKQHADDHSTRFVLAVSYLAQGEQERAYKEYQRLHEKLPDNAAVLNDLAWLKYERGESGALQMAERAQRLAPDNPLIEDTYGWILLHSGRVESALTVLRQASTKLPDNLDIRYHYAAALAQAGEKAEAGRVLDAMLNSGRTFAEREQAVTLRERL